MPAAPAAAPLPAPSTTTTARTSNAAAAAAALDGRTPPGAATLLGCLRGFVAPEPLGVDGWRCDACGGRATPPVKQMSIRRAPPVLCLHVKRFEHGHGGWAGGGGGGQRGAQA